MKKPLLTILFLTLSLLVLGSVSAADDEKQFLLSEKTYKALNQAQELMEKENYQQAKQQLDSLLSTVEKGSYEQAVVLQTLGFLYSSLEQYKKATETFQQALDLNALPEDVTHTLRYNLAQLLIADGQYKKGIPLMESWLAAENKPDNTVYVLLASAYYRVDNFSKAADRIQIAIKNDKAPKEDWYRLLLSSHLSLKHYKSAISVLELLITRYPDKKMYWDQLAALYMQENKEFTSLAVRMLAKRLDLTEPKTLVNLADMYRYLRVPYKAGQLLEQGMEQNIISSNFENLNKLADSWLAARENQRAVDTLKVMLPMDSSGDTQLKLGQIYISMEQWGNAIDTLSSALKLLKGKKLGQTYAMLGTAYYHQDNLEQAKAQFLKAASFEAQKKQAAQWLQHINSLLEKNDEPVA
ncbi:tetratricopeptide repeat protein [Methylophaga thalassica]|uniref:tetratricopeptide repeat protein n=1 Tax=Methylophaga aminisulfidivorans TaxID=230105 RepID=UPI0024E20E4F|nr:tetratricopeptide repeat protein [Methylophaga aminisulfidivorans]